MSLSSSRTLARRVVIAALLTLVWILGATAADARRAQPARKQTKQRAKASKRGKVKARPKARAKTKPAKVTPKITPQAPGRRSPAPAPRRRIYVSGGEEDEDDWHPQPVVPTKAQRPGPGAGLLALVPVFPALAPSKLLLPTGIGGARWWVVPPKRLSTRESRRLRKRARTLVRRGWYAGARRVLQTLVSAFPRNLKARALLMRVQDRLGDLRGLARNMRWLQRQATNPAAARLLRAHSKKTNTKP